MCILPESSKTHDFYCDCWLRSPWNLRTIFVHNIYALFSTINLYFFFFFFTLTRTISSIKMISIMTNYLNIGIDLLSKNLFVIWSIFLERYTSLRISYKEFLQEQKLHSKRETLAILRSFGYSSLISDFDMIW